MNGAAPGQQTFLRRAKRKKVHRKQPVEWFEKYRHKGIAAVHARMQEDHLRPPE